MSRAASEASAASATPRREALRVRTLGIRPTSSHSVAGTPGRVLYTAGVPEGQNPSDLLRGLEILRSAFVPSGNVGDSLPAAVERAGEVRAAIDRLTDEVATLNAHVERAL